ncbi:MAG: alcohol dehydrogenase catalytic domain-containing protein [Elusimicrobia bacterium]|nr:alcohol dehydrogenase catalytic domain-containing protein [Elusimicrobiota bacterium]
MSGTYRAVVVEGPGKARLVERPIPVPKTGEVLVRTAWQGICATDLEVLEGTLGYYKNGMAKYPIVPGHEFSGTITATGHGTGGFAVGDRVVLECIQGCGACAACLRDDAIACPARREMGVMNLDGGYAELVLAPARAVHRVPPGVSLRAASLAEPLAVVCKGLRRLAPAWGPEPEPRRVAVVGGGAIGTLAALVLEARGHRPAVFDRDAGRRALLVKAGLEARDALTGLGEFDAFVEATGNADALHAALEGSRPGAAFLLLGFPYDRRPFAFESLVGFDRTVVGSVGSGSKDFEAALRLLGRLDLSTLACEAFPLEGYEKAWAAARAKGCLKAVLRVGPEAA